MACGSPSPASYNALVAAITELAAFKLYRRVPARLRLPSELVEGKEDEGRAAREGSSGGSGKMSLHRLLDFVPCKNESEQKLAPGIGVAPPTVTDSRSGSQAVGPHDPGRQCSDIDRGLTSATLGTAPSASSTPASKTLLFTCLTKFLHHGSLVLDLA